MISVTALRGVFALLFIFCVNSSCGNAKGTNFSVTSSGADGEGDRKVPWPERGLEAGRQGDSHLEQFDTGNNRILGSGHWPNQVLLNFDGDRVFSDQSFIVQAAGFSYVDIEKTDFAQMGGDGDEDTREIYKQDLLQQLRVFFEGVSLNIVLNEADLAPGPFTLVNIGGDSFLSDQDLVGIAPLDLGNFNGGDIAFVFPLELPEVEFSARLRLLAIAAAHEIAHSLGARHIVADTAIMQSSVDLHAEEFNVRGNLIDSPGTENSQEILIANTRQNRNQSGLPLVTGLEAVRMRNVGQFVPKFASEPNAGFDPSRLEYRWHYRGETVTGHAVRIAFTEHGYEPLRLTVKDKRSDQEQVFEFEVGREKKQR